MNKEQLEQIANGMVADGKGILAADESTGTIKNALIKSTLNQPMTVAGTTANCFSGRKTP